MAWTGKNKKGKTVTLLNPKEKKQKFQKELKYDRKVTNDGSFKRDKNKKGIPLTESEKAYRHGYISATIDSGKAYYARKSKKGK